MRCVMTVPLTAFFVLILDNVICLLEAREYARKKMVQTPENGVNENRKKSGSDTHGKKHTFKIDGIESYFFASLSDRPFSSSILRQSAIFNVLTCILCDSALTFSTMK